MAFGVEEPRSLAISTGVVVGFFGALMIGVNFKVGSTSSLVHVSMH